MLSTVRAVFRRAEEGGYVCWLVELPEVMSQGETKKEAKENLIDALKEVLQYRFEEAQQEMKLHSDYEEQEVINLSE